MKVIVDKRPEVAEQCLFYEKSQKGYSCRFDNLHCLCPQSCSYLVTIEEYICQSIKESRDES